MSDDRPTSQSIEIPRRPIMALLDLLGQKWALRILWELQGGELSSRALRTAAGEISPTVLQARIHELREAGIVESGKSGYGLTRLGIELTQAFLPLYRFAEKWDEAVNSRPPQNKAVAATKS
ncbi:winged helix-turn-helix transcriptional regulator [Pseudomonas sp. RHF3.3-3]|uniref:winged helix-turn-helix transcriptional regulator n=1 Tax=Pseudomonas sp. RHF3.3-3 TaxID=3396624 RepID=UPI003A899C65